MISDEKTIDTLISLLGDRDTPLHIKRHIRESIISFLCIKNSTFGYAWEKTSDGNRSGNAHERQQMEMFEVDGLDA